MCLNEANPIVIDFLYFKVRFSSTYNVAFSVTVRESKMTELFVAEATLRYYNLN